MKSARGVSLIALIITIAIIIIIAGVTIQNGKGRTDQAKIAKHNTNISTIQEEIESYYYSKGGELPIKDLSLYPITKNPELLAEITKNSEQTDNFYILDFSRLGKVSGKESVTSNGDVYIISATRHNVYYSGGNVVNGRTYYGLISNNDIKLAQVTKTEPQYAYNNPIVPMGFTRIGDENWENGYTIEDENGNQFVWVPVLDPRVKADGTLDGTNYNSKFGRRAFQGEAFSPSYFYEVNDTALQDMTSSINKYGGFYIAKYEMSNNNDKGQSKANVASWSLIDWSTSKSKAESMDTDWKWNTDAVESYLCYGAHWDTTLEWLIDSGDKTLTEIKDNSSSWGNYFDDAFSGTTGVGNTGQWSQTCAKGIYDLAGNLMEWTMENRGNATNYVYHGGCYSYGGADRPAGYRRYNIATHNSIEIGWRAVLYVK